MKRICLLPLFLTCYLFNTGFVQKKEIYPDSPALVRVRTKQDPNFLFVHVFRIDRPFISVGSLALVGVLLQQEIIFDTHHSKIIFFR